MNKVSIVTTHCGNQMGDLVLFHSLANAKRYVQTEIYDCWMDNIKGMLEDELGESTLDDVERVFSYCEEQGLYKAFETDGKTDGIYQAYAGGNDWLEFKISRRILPDDYEDNCNSN